MPEAIFIEWENFARYGFNKSHAADYGIIAVQTAYLKSHYTTEYMTALLSASKNDTDKVAHYVADCRDLGIEVLSPDVNSSGWDFTIEDRPDNVSVIRFGLGAVKNVGLAPVQIILDARKEDGPFSDINDFTRRVDLRQVGKRALESLVRVGALDRFGERRALLDALDQITAISASQFKAAECGQLSIFGLDESFTEEIELPQVVSVDAREKLEWEKELMGLYVSAHPMTTYNDVLRKKVTSYSSQLAQMKSKAKVTVGGMVTRFRRHQTKNGKEMGFVTIEDMQGVIDLVVFPGPWNKYRDLIQNDRVLIIEGKIDDQNSDPKIIVDVISEISTDELSAAFDGAQENNNQTSLDFSEFDLGYDMSIGPSSEMTEGFQEEIELDDDAIPLSEELIDEEQQPVEKIRESVQSYQTESIEDDDDMPPPPDFSDDWFNSLATETPTKQSPLDVQPVEKPVEKVAKTVSVPVVEPSSGVSVKVVPEIKNKPVSLPVVLPPFDPFRREDDKDKQEMRMITVVLRSTKDVNHGVRCMKRVVGLLRSYPGKDKFGVMLFDGVHRVQLEFPNDNTGYSPDLIRKLQNLVGEENVSFKTILVH